MKIALVLLLAQFPSLEWEISIPQNKRDTQYNVLQQAFFLAEYLLQMSKKRVLSQ